MEELEQKRPYLEFDNTSQDAYEIDEDVYEIEDNDSHNAHSNDAYDSNEYEDVKTKHQQGQPHSNDVSLEENERHDLKERKSLPADAHRTRKTNNNEGLSYEEDDDDIFMTVEQLQRGQEKHKAQSVKETGRASYVEPSAYVPMDLSRQSKSAAARQGYTNTAERQEKHETTPSSRLRSETDNNPDVAEYVVKDPPDSRLSNYTNMTNKDESNRASTQNNAKQSHSSQKQERGGDSQGGDKRMTLQYHNVLITDDEDYENVDIRSSSKVQVTDQQQEDIYEINETTQHHNEELPTPQRYQTKIRTKPKAAVLRADDVTIDVKRQKETTPRIQLPSSSPSQERTSRLTRLIQWAKKTFNPCGDKTSQYNFALLTGAVVLLFIVILIVGITT